MADKDMPRKAVISKLAESHDLSKVEAERVLRTALLAISEQLALRGRFHVAEVGSITVAKRPPRRYFNPRTKKDAISEGDISLKINISKQMRKRIDQD
jgi:nucleoid DNA-binding protein